MIESDAKMKWCPSVRLQTATLQGTMNRCNDGTVPYSSMCVGSACMLWRWDESRATAAGIEAGVAHGYCGLAPLYAQPPAYINEASPFSVSELNALKDRRVGKGVYNNPQPGDTDFPGG